MSNIPSDDDLDELAAGGIVDTAEEFSFSTPDNSKPKETGINSDLPIVAETYLQGLIDLIISMYDVVSKFYRVADSFEGAVMWYYYDSYFSYDGIRTELENNYRDLACIRKRISEFKGIKYSDITRFNVNKSNYERVLLAINSFNSDFFMFANYLNHMIEVASKIHYKIAVRDSLNLKKQSISAIKEINKIIKRYNKYLDKSFMMRFPLIFFKI
jgi:hypothetical protein